jgi:WD40 repeat protein
VYGIAVSATEGAVVSVGPRRILRFWDRSGALVRATSLGSPIPEEALAVHESIPPALVAFSPNGDTVFTADNASPERVAIRAWDPSTGTVAAEMPFDAPITCLVPTSSRDAFVATFPGAVAQVRPDESRILRRHDVGPGPVRGLMVPPRWRGRVLVEPLWGEVLAVDLEALVAKPVGHPPRFAGIADDSLAILDAFGELTVLPLESLGRGFSVSLPVASSRFAAGIHGRSVVVVDSTGNTSRVSVDDGGVRSRRLWRDVGSVVAVDVRTGTVVVRERGRTEVRTLSDGSVFHARSEHLTAIASGPGTLALGWRSGRVDVVLPPSPDR